MLLFGNRGESTVRTYPEDRRHRDHLPSTVKGVQPRQYLLPVVAVAASCWMFRAQMEALDLRLSAALSSTILIGLLFIHIRVAKGRGLTVGLGYAALAILFHGGLLLPLAITGSVELFNEVDSRWFTAQYIPSAAWLSCLGLLAYTLGYLIWAPTTISLATAPQASLSTVASKRVGNLGLIILALGMFAWTLWVYQAGALNFGSSYIEFLAQTSDSQLAYAYLAMGVGLPIAATSNRAWRVAMLLFGLWSVQAFVLGLRGEVLLPAIAALVVRSRQERLRLWPMAAVGLLALCAGAFVRSIRVDGLSTSTASVSAFNPLDGLVEMGYSIRPVVVALQWSHNSEPYSGLATYWHPLVRPLGVNAPAVTSDPAAFSAVVNQRVGAIGGSPIAEAFRAGGPWAVILLMGLTGLLCAWLDARKSSAVSAALVGSITFVLLLWVRNDFVPVPAQIALALTVVGITKLIVQRDESALSTHDPSSVAPTRRTLGPP